jgi:hypothetical protein
VEEPLYVWITTRRIKPGSYEEFSRAWRPDQIPEGMLKAFEFYAEDRNEVVGVSFWDTPALGSSTGSRTFRCDGGRRWRPTSTTSTPASTWAAS